jgi:hypothetical protein
MVDVILSSGQKNKKVSVKMKKRFSWDDLRNRWNLESCELLQILPFGLQPYSEFENPISLRGLLNELPDADQTESIKNNWKELPWPINDRIAEHLISRLSSAWFYCDDVRTVENETGLVKLTRPTLWWLDGNDLLERWSIDEFGLCKMIVEYGLPAYDTKTLRSVKTGSSSRNELGEMVAGTDHQRIQAMERLRFKPFEIDEFEDENEGLFNTGLMDHAPAKESVQDSTSTSDTDGKDKCIFSFKNDFWMVNYFHEKAILKDKKGLQHIVFLIRNTGTEIPCRTIYHGIITGEGDLEIDYDDYLEKKEIDIIISQAKKICKIFFSYLEKPESSEKEKAIQDWRQVRNNLFELGLMVRCSRSGIKYKQVAKASKFDEKARYTVTNNIKNALKEIGTKMPKLAEHLSVRLKTGYKCSYKQDPENSILWEISDKNAAKN